MKKTILLTVLLAVLTSVTFSQVAINETGADPDPSAILDLSSTDKGFLVPRVSSAERNAIATTQSGLLVYDIDTESFWYYNNMLANWVEMSGGGADSDWIVVGDNMYSSVSGNVGIGTSSPDVPFEVVGSYWENIVKIHDDNYYGNALIFSNGANWASISGSTTNRDDIVIEHETGEIGIGTSSPAAKLDVNGSIRMTDGNQGSGKVLVSDAMGIASWEIPTIYASDINGLSDGIAFSSTVYLGDEAGTFTTGNNNTGIGHQSGRAITSGFANTSIGKSANENNETGIRNTAIGAFAGRGSFGGPSVSDCIFIGVSAGSQNTSNNKLFIDVTDTPTPLIGGDFSTDQVDINGTIKISGGNPGVGKVLTSDEEGLAAWETVSPGVESINDLSDAKTNASNIFLGMDAGINDNGNNFNTALGIESLKENTEGTCNTATGYKALAGNINGNKNTAFGVNSLSANTMGANNVAVGYRASYYNTTGYSNTSLGTKALFRSTYQHNIVAIGDSALMSNGFGGTLSTHGSENTAVGSKALYANTLGNQNTAIGIGSLIENTEGKDNTAVGAYALQHNVDADNNTAMGAFALTMNTSGMDNTAFGFKSAYHITDGASNSAFGTLALYSDSTGINNSAFGRSSLFLNKTGGENTAHGYRALYKNVEGHNNTAIGSYAGYKALGSGNVFVGRNAGYNEEGSDKLYIDNSNTASPLIYGDFSSNIVAVNGKLGIGTQSPSEKLEVIGKAVISDDLEVGDDIVATDDITADEFKYGSTKTCILKIPAAAFSLFTNQDGDKMVHNDNGYWFMDSDDGNGTSTIKAPVSLPDGAIVTRFSIYYRCDGEWIEVKLWKKDEMSISADIMASYDVLYNYFNISKFDDTSISYATIDNNGRFYYITAKFLGHDQLDFGQLHGAEIEYTIDKVTH
ncbi:MAG: hypothetical protein JEY97_03825 [Bacteroidales bacterium]|nr:hypothetical protein [Bacteroidales bacterium]